MNPFIERVIDSTPLTAIFTQSHILISLEQSGITRIGQLKQNWNIFDRILQKKSNSNSNMGSLSLNDYQGINSRRK